MKRINFGEFLQQLDPGAYLHTRSLFLRLLGVVYLFAFVSLWTQIIGLVGANGILPIASYLQEAGQHLSGLDKFHKVPTLSWLSPSNGFLIFQCVAGTVLAVVLIAGFVPVAALAGLWILWLSLTVAGQEFLLFQWDNLLLETGFLAIFLAPLSLTLRSAEPPSGRVLWLIRWLLFRLLFLSGAVKLISGDPSWRNFTALFYHFETQPLPTVLGWAAYQLPTWTQVIQTGVMYFIELIVPFLIFFPRRIRIAAFFPIVLLQIGIALTGNYAYFNFLTIVLCVLLLDDEALQKIVRLMPRIPPAQTHRLVLAKIHSIAVAVVTVVIVIITALQMVSMLTGKQNWGRSVLALYRLVDPLRSINTYGLFAVMTKSRPEIIVEGSHDGQNWIPYEFKHKPGDLNRRPGFIAPHQPRLDWQMWFAALGEYQQNRWFVNFCTRLAQNQPDVLALLRTNPFPEKPPKFIRATKYIYEFTDFGTLRTSGQWWRRENPEEYLPMVSGR